MTKEETIQSIKRRILDEHKKYSTNIPDSEMLGEASMWAECAARKIYSSLFNRSNNICDQIFEQSSKVDDYEFNLHQHWKDEDNIEDRPIGGFHNDD